MTQPLRSIFDQIYRDAGLEPPDEIPPKVRRLLDEKPHLLDNPEALRTALELPELPDDFKPLGQPGTAAHKRGTGGGKRRRF